MNHPQIRLRPGATGRGDSTNNVSNSSNFSTDPFELVLSKLEGVQRHGNDNARAKSPLSDGKHSRSLSISRGANGTVLLNDFAGHPVHEVLAAIGLTVGDLFVRRDLRNLSPSERSQMRQDALIPRWRAALEVLSREATVLQIAAGKMGNGDLLDAGELTRMQASALRIHDIMAVLNAR